MKYIVSTGRTDILYRDIIESEETEKQLVTVGGRGRLHLCSLMVSPCMKARILLTGGRRIHRQYRASEEEIIAFRATISR